MLRELHIRNFVLIDELNLEFDPGFNVLTGETGAGKSIIVDALNLLLGERVRGDLIRPGSEEATVEAVFETANPRNRKRLESALKNFGLESDSDGLFIKRSIRRDGRGRCYVNSSPTQLKVLDELGNLLVDIHGQHEHQSLLHGEVYMDFLDAYAGLESSAESVRRRFEELQEIEKQIVRLEEAQRERRRQEDQLRFQIKEIEEAALVPGEDEELDADRRRLQYAGRLAENTEVIQSLLIEGTEERQPILDGLAEVQRRLKDILEVDATLSQLERDLSVALIQIEEVGREVASYGQAVENDPARLEQVEERLHLIRHLKSKYGAGIEEILHYLKQAQQQLEELESAEESLADLTVRREAAIRRFVEEAVGLSHHRQKAAVKLSRAVTRELKELGMEHGRFMVQLEALGESGVILQVDEKSYRASWRGIDHVEFLVHTNPGQEPGVLRQVASGGEISRIALAIKTVLASVDQVGSLVFDEIDSGIGGNIADVIGSKFRKVAAERQVICITHLPQIAGKGHRNFRVTKSVGDGRTQSRVELIEGEQLEQEIARMLGDESSSDSLNYARKLIAQGRQD